MKKISIYIFLLTLIGIGCGEERVETNYTEYSPDIIAHNDGKVSYTNFETFPLLQELSGTAPEFDISSVYKFTIDTVKAPAGSTFSLNKLSIDAETGVISYDNSGDDLSVGDYVVTVALQAPNGIALYDDVYTMNVRDVPGELTVDNSIVDVGSLELGSIATVSYIDNSGSGLITDISYELVSPPAHYEMDAVTGEITKKGAANQGTEILSVIGRTNLGTLTAIDLVIINVGASPTIQYFQQDGSTPLTKVTVSSWSAYTTSTPTLNDMTAASWEMMLPASLAGFENVITIQSDGEIDIAADSNLPEGDHLIGVLAINGGGVSKDFPDLFTLTVEFRWATLFDDQIDSPDENINPEEAYPGIWAGYDVEGSSDKEGWKKVAGVGGGGFTGMRRWDPGTLDACLTRVIDISTVKALRVSFGEIIGYGAVFTDRYAREFYYGESTTNLEAATFDGSEWNTLLAEDGPWLGTNWNMGNGPENFYENIPIDLSNISGNTLYLNWRLYSKDVAAGNQNGQFIITQVQTEQADIFDAEEE